MKERLLTEVRRVSQQGQALQVISNPDMGRADCQSIRGSNRGTPLQGSMSQSTAFLQHFLGPRESPSLPPDTSSVRPGRVNPLVISLRLKAPATSAAPFNSGSVKNHAGLHKTISKLWRKEEKKKTNCAMGKLQQKGKGGRGQKWEVLEEGGREASWGVSPHDRSFLPATPPTRAQEGDKNLHHLLPSGGPQPLPLQPCPLPLPL